MTRRQASRAGSSLRLVLAASMALAMPVARSAAGWFESGDAQMRLDLQLLNDARVIRYPVSQWPIPRAALDHAVSLAKEHFATNAAVNAALERVRARLDAGAPAGFSAAVRGGQAGLLRDFDSLSREDGELEGGFDFASGRFSVGVTATVVVDPDDGQEIRVDGSHATVQFGNWLISANTLDRWWGPAHEGSLILSNNARPMPTLMVERAAARPFESRWLNWLGPWRFNFGVSQMENNRADIDSPLFMAWRVAIMPFKDIELGFSRTAQFCGEQLACDLDVFGNMLAGNDNVGIDATPENEPGNQMAGFDIRWSSPIGNFPYAIYSQMIGEDESSYLPVKYLAQFGVEAWKPMAAGALLQGFAEYSDTTCSANRNPPRFNCAYNQGLFDVEGYRYRGRVIGHTTDRDAESLAVGATLLTTAGATWSATLRRSDLNRDDRFDPENTVSAGPAEYAALELGWKGRWRGESIAIEVGMESFEPQGQDRDVEPFGFLSWRHEFSR